MSCPRWEVSLLPEVILDVLSENKAEDVLNISLKGKSEQADQMIIATGTSNRHVSALSEKIIAEVKSKKGIYARTEGLNNSDWVLIDFGDVIVHIFRQEVRDFYQLEKFWQNLNDSNTDMGNA